ncbi:hypothetical protein U9M48_042103, partial [Paspalum notatum var. saurae]
SPPSVSSASTPTRATIPHRLPESAPTPTASIPAPRPRRSSHPQRVTASPPCSEPPTFAAAAIAPQSAAPRFAASAPRALSPPPSTRGPIIRRRRVRCHRHRILLRDAQICRRATSMSSTAWSTDADAGTATSSPTRRSTLPHPLPCCAPPPPTARQRPRGSPRASATQPDRKSSSSPAGAAPVLQARPTSSSLSRPIATVRALDLLPVGSSAMPSLVGTTVALQYHLGKGRHLGKARTPELSHLVLVKSSTSALAYALED